MSDEFDSLLTEPQRVSPAHLAELFGVSTRTISELTKREIITRNSQGYDEAASVRAYCAHLRAMAGNQTQSTTLTAERVRVAKEQADKLAIANAIARREMLPAADVQSTWSGILRDVRARLLAVPSRCGAALAHLTPHDIAAIDRELRDALKEIADAD